jgi:hypothetical protein
MNYTGNETILVHLKIKIKNYHYKTINPAVFADEWKDASNQPHESNEYETVKKHSFYQN